MVKRMFDVVVASLMFVVLAPILIVIAGVVLATMGRPVLFRQVRPGLDGYPFEMVKFRTMTNAAKADGQLLPNASRMTRVGRFLRASSLDELPELWNVLKGEMSLVGPRPLLVDYLRLYTPHQMRRHEVRPGITGWAQVNGRNTASWDERFEMDVWYVDNRTLWLDVCILILTIWKVVRRDDISVPGRDTIERFKGSNKQ